MKRKPDERFQPGAPPDRPQSAEDRIFDMQTAETSLDKIDRVKESRRIKKRDRGIETAIYVAFALFIGPPLLFFILLWIHHVRVWRALGL